jgi:uncharacterized protein involved in exopolysaccharide biosynthesis
MNAPAPLEADLGALLLLAVRSTVRSWRALSFGVITGALIGGAVVAFVPASFSGRALVLIRTQSSPTAALAAKAGPLAELSSGALGNAFKDELETELAILRSRAAAAVVVDSLRLQLRPLSPVRVPPLGLVDSVRLAGRFKPFTATLKPGQNTLPQGTVWIRANAPAVVRAKLYDREDAIDEIGDRLDVRKEGGEVVRVAYRGRDSLTAADVPNLLVATYLNRRKTVDRGVNQRRFEFMVAASDSIGRDLQAAAGSRRRLQDASDLPAVEPAVRALVEQVAELETKLGMQRAEETALDSLLVHRGDPRLLAAFPAFLRSPAVNELVSQLAQLDVKRQGVLVNAPPGAASIKAIEGARDSLAAQLAPMARTYRRSLADQRQPLEVDLARARARLRALPGAQEAFFVVESRLARLAALENGMGTQVLQARLAALTEGGDVRLVDLAVAPRKVTFPRPLLTVALGALLGVLAVLALVLVAPARARAA